MELIVLGVLMVLVAIIFVIILYNNKKKCPVKTTAKIVEVKQEQYYNNDKDSHNQINISCVYRPVYEFDLGNNKFQVSDIKAYKSRRNLKRVGKYVSLYYNKSNPSQIYVADNILNTIIAIVILVGITITLLGILIILNII